MKKLNTLFILFSLIYGGSLYGQLSGTAFLSGQTDHSGITVKFISTGGTAVTDSTTTDSAGNYSKTITGGVYTVVMSKAGYLDTYYNSGNSLVLTNTTVLNSTTLNPGNTVSVSGNASGTWTSTNSYIVNGTVTVPSGQTLTIEPGTIVKFNGYYSIIVNGSLIAEGTASNRITFTSNKAVPAADDWYAVEVNGAFTSFEYCLFEYAHSCLWITNCSPVISHNEFRHFLMQGVRADNCSSIVQNNEIHDFQYPYGQGIVFNGSAPGVVICNRVYNGGGYGIRPCTNMLVKNNEVFNMASFGIHHGYGFCMIENNYVHHCIEGIHVGESVTPTPTPTIFNNTITNNTTGVLFTNFHAAGKLINNIITGNGKGIRQVLPGCPAPTCSTTPDEVSYNLVWNNANGNYDNVQITGLGQMVSTNAQGNAVDPYFNLSQDPLFTTAPFLDPASPCLGAGQASYSEDIGFFATVSCGEQTVDLKAHEAAKISCTLYPNPTSGQFALLVKGIPGNSTLTVFNAIGQQVHEQKLSAGSNGIDMTGVPPGIYLYMISSSSGSLYSNKLVIE